MTEVASAPSPSISLKIQPTELPQKVLGINDFAAQVMANVEEGPVVDSYSPLCPLTVFENGCIAPSDRHAG